MIARIEGVLEALDSGSALVRTGSGLTYEVLLSAYAAGRLGGNVGQNVSLHTLHFLESANQGATLTPRLAGFLSPHDRRFYQLFTTCKGIGNKKALRALTLDTARIAGAIADRDVALLQSLPEIGRRLAETIVATLSGKVDDFVSAAAFTEAGGRSEAPALDAPRRGMAREALEVLLQLGENRVQAVQWIDQALSDEANRPTTSDELVARVYRLKSGAALSAGATGA